MYEENDKQYELLINARNFHYDNFSKWMSFFYIAIGGIFVGYYSLLTSNSNEEYVFEKLLLLLMGYAVSLCWHWSCKGYYYWIINWIMLIQNYEKKFPEEARVYNCFANKNANNNYFKLTKAANISTSKLVLFFSFLTVISWGVLFVHQLLKYLGYDTIYCIILFFIIIIVFSVFLGYVPKKFFYSDLSHMPDLSIKNNK